MKITMKQIKEAESQLKPCPFCGKSVEIMICDYDGNPKDAEYLKDPWNGLAFVITHNGACLMYCNKDENLCIGQFRFESLISLVNTWNHRPQAHRIERVLDEMESWADGEEKNNHYDCRNLGTDAVRGWATVIREHLAGGAQ